MTGTQRISDRVVIEHECRGVTVVPNLPALGACDEPIRSTITLHDGVIENNDCFRLESRFNYRCGVSRLCYSRGICQYRPGKRANAELLREYEKQIKKAISPVLSAPESLPARNAGL